MVDPYVSQAQRERMLVVVKGELLPDPVHTAEDVIAIATSLKRSAWRTSES